MSATLIASIYSGGVDGIWLDADDISRFKRDGVTLSAYSNPFDQWVDRSGNGRDVSEVAGVNTNDWGVYTRDTSYHAGYSIGTEFASTAGGGSSTAFYAAFSVDGGGTSQYYATLFSDINTTNTGFDLKYSGDVGGWIFSAGTGSARVSVTVESQALYGFMARNVVEVWYDGSNIGIRVNKQYTNTAACSSVSAGNLAIKFAPGGAYVGDYYEAVIFKNHCPSQSDRNRIASYMAAQQAITGLPPFGDMGATEPAGYGADTTSISGSGTVSNSMQAQEPAGYGADTPSISGTTLARTGTLGATEIGTDTFNAAQTTVVGVTGFGRASEYGVQDTTQFSTAATPRSGTLGAVEPANDTTSITGNVLVNRTGSMSAVEPAAYGADTFQTSSGAIITGTLGATEIGTDTFQAVSPGSSDTAFLAWLTSDSKIPTLLVEVTARVGGVETTRYLSSTGYTTSAGESPADTHYLGVIIGGGTVTEELPLDGQASMAFGDIEIANVDGALDSWLNDVWAGRQCKMYVGDQRWARTSFRLVFDGIVADLTSRSRDVLNLVMRDKLERLNTAVTETKLGGTSQNADELLPICYGEVHNIEPLLIDKALLKYQVNAGPIERLIEVRDFGMPVSATVTLAAGTFVLAASPAGTITCSVQGRKPSVYFNTVSQAIQQLVTEGGSDPFSYSTDMDINNLAAFDAANPQPIGLYLSSRENILDVSQQLASSVGAQMVMPATGKLRLLKIALPATATPTAVGSEQMYERTLQIVQRVPVRSAIKLGYARNWTVQENLQTGILPEHKDLFAKEWLTVTASDSSVATIYKQTQEPEQEDTLLQVKADAENEAARRLALWKVPRMVVSYDGLPELITQELGGYQTITHSRFNLSSGVTGQIIKVTRDWLNARVSFEVLL